MNALKLAWEKCWHQWPGNLFKKFGRICHGFQELYKKWLKTNEIAVCSQNDEDYICITDIARYKNSDRTDDLIRNWLRNRNTIEFLGIWEQLNQIAIRQMKLLTEDTGIKKLEGNYRWFPADEALRKPHALL
jgi:hypothetical protein